MLVITFHNDSTGVNLQGNYNVKVYVNDKVIYSGRVEGHDRRKGWPNLVRMFIRKVHAKTQYLDMFQQMLKEGK